MDALEEKTETLRLLLVETGFSRVASETELEDLAATLATSLIQGNQQHDLLELLVEYFGCPRRLSTCKLMAEMTEKLKRAKLQ